MGRKPKSQRREDQRVRQQDQRDKAKKACKPSRDDVARMTLWWLISGTWKNDRNARVRLDSVRDALTDLLQAQGFDGQAAGDEIERLYVLYRTDNPPFRIKRHLKPNQPPAGMI
ncbi:hypothetical protein [Rhizobium sp. TRM95796]|uniref:hypothetical protein n=1 Tax=Rhizobium sp. TRM95796 TaxID=2979862 RepID=UPI0021E838C7|nr:hypothetical protein [Rhizobium sp. TRM95796]MCV3768736.1 hypothetical protein [Rhizobium sp. TRM95796]